jgi:hypothetical protein
MNKSNMFGMCSYEFYDSYGIPCHTSAYSWEENWDIIDLYYEEMGEKM